MNKIFISLVIIFSATLFAQNNIYLVSDQSELEFEATGNPSMMTVTGKAQKLTGNLTLSPDGKLSGEVLLPLKELDTGIDMRTNHMKEKYLEIQKENFSSAKFSFENLDTTKSPLAYEGQLTLHGVTKKISGSAELSKSENIMNVDSKFKIKLSEFAITIPSYAGITIEDEIQLKVNLKSELKK